MSRPCTCGLATRPRRVFGKLERTDGAPSSGTGFETLGAPGLPSAAAPAILSACRNRDEIQGARRSLALEGCSRVRWAGAAQLERPSRRVFSAPQNEGSGVNAQNFGIRTLDSAAPNDANHDKMSCPTH